MLPSMLNPTMTMLMIFLLACVAGYSLSLHVSPALYTPFLSMTTAISSVIILAAFLGAGSDFYEAPTLLSEVAVVLASINLFGGFILTQRLLNRYVK